MFDFDKARDNTLKAIRILGWDVRDGRLYDEKSGGMARCGGKTLLPFDRKSIAKKKKGISEFNEKFDVFKPFEKEEHLQLLEDKVYTEPRVSEIISFREDETSLYHAKIIDISGEIMLESGEGSATREGAIFSVILRFYGL